MVNFRFLANFRFLTLIVTKYITIDTVPSLVTLSLMDYGALQDFSMNFLFTNHSSISGIVQIINFCIYFRLEMVLG